MTIDSAPSGALALRTSTTPYKLKSSFARRRFGGLIDQVSTSKVFLCSESHCAEPVCFSGKRFLSIEFSNRYPQLDLERAEFLSCDMRKSNLTGFDLTGANLSASSLDVATVTDALVDDAKLIDVSCQWSSWSNSSLVNSDLSGTDFSGADVSNCDFSGCDLQGARFCSAVAIGASFYGANLTDCDFGYADLSNSIMSKAELDATNFSYAKMNGCQFHPVNFRGGNYYKIIFDEKWPVDWPCHAPAEGDAAYAAKMRSLRRFGRSHVQLVLALMMCSVWINHLAPI